VIHPAAYSYFRNASKQDNAAATERETTKIRKYAELNAINPAPINYQFCPLVVESFGSWSDAACKIIVRIAKSQATVIGLAGYIAVFYLIKSVVCRAVSNKRVIHLLFEHAPHVDLQLLQQSQITLKISVVSFQVARPAFQPSKA
jgi:hypothetical protein